MLFGSEPFSSLLRCSNLNWYKYDWVWEKSKGANIASVNFQPLRTTENVMVFSDGASTYTKSQNAMRYNPQLVPLPKPYVRSFVGNKYKEEAHVTAPLRSNRPDIAEYTHSYPRNVLRFSSVFRGKEHPTQKPVDLMAYLIRTYTNPGETVLDFTMGSGTTGVAAIQEGRRFVGIEKDAGYSEIAQRRISEATRQPALLEVA